METNLAPSAPTPRWYGNASCPYTPLNTQSLPRLGCINDFFPVRPGVIGVVLQDGSIVLVEERDYFLLQMAGWTARWTQRRVTGDNCYPSINHGDKIRTIARIILDARDGERIKYRNGNQNDVTRENLILKAKGGKEVGFSHRTCAQAPILSQDERGRMIAIVASAVGCATMQDRLAVGNAAVSKALLSMSKHRPASMGARA